MYADKIDYYVRRFGKILGRNYFYQDTVYGHRILESSQNVHEVILAPTENELRVWIRLKCVKIRSQLRDLI